MENKPPAVPKPAWLLHAERMHFVGLVNVICTVHILSTQPYNYFIVHFVKNVLYLIARYFSFKKKHLLWYLTEFCYVTNYLTFLYIGICVGKKYLPFMTPLKPYLDPFGPLLFKLGFVWSMGPLAWSISFFRNALVLHSLDHLGILAVHVGPPLLCWGMRFHSAELHKQWPDTFHIGEVDAPLALKDSLYSLFLIPCVAYLVLWLLPYSLLQFVMFSDAIRKKGEKTMTRDLPQLASLPEDQRAWVYCRTHAALSFLSFALAQVWWRSYYACTLFLCAQLCCSLWAGSTFQFESFGGGYVFEKRDKKKAEQQAQTALQTREEQRTQHAADKDDHKQE